MRDLLDANLLLALSAPDHVHHARARQYWMREAAQELVLCRLTTLALLRLLTNPRVLGPAAMPGQAAWSALGCWLQLPSVVFLPEPAGIDDLLTLWSADHDLRAGAWTDAYLAAFAHGAQCRLVTFDQGFARFQGLECLLLTQSG